MNEKNRTHEEKPLVEILHGSNEETIIKVKFHKEGIAYDGTTFKLIQTYLYREDGEWAENIIGAALSILLMEEITSSLLTTIENNHIPVLFTARILIGEYTDIIVEKQKIKNNIIYKENVIFHDDFEDALFNMPLYLKEYDIFQMMNYLINNPYKNIYFSSSDSMGKNRFYEMEKILHKQTLERVIENDSRSDN